MRYNFSHEQLAELYSGVKHGTWLNHEVRMELIKLFEDYFIELATSPLYKITKKKLGKEQVIHDLVTKAKLGKVK